MRASGSAGQRGHGLHLLRAGENAALQLEIVEAVARLRGFGEAHDGLGRQRLFVAQTQPVVLGVGSTEVGQIGLLAVSDIEQIAEHQNLLALLALAEQRGDGHVEELAQQIEQSGFDGGDGMDGDAQVEGLRAASAGIAVGEALPDGVQDAVIGGDGLADAPAAWSPRAFDECARRRELRRRRCGRHCLSG